MIAFACPGCGHKMQVRDDLAGKRGKCPQCKQGIVVPSAVGMTAQMAGANAPAGDVATLPPTAAPRTSDAATLAPFGAGRRAGGPATPPPGGPESIAEAMRTNSPATPGVAAELFDFLAPAQSEDEIGRLGPYRVLKILGAGGMGVVYLAEDPTLQRRVALKVMLPALAVSASAKERFLREARAAAAIEHDHIVPIYQVGEDRGVPYLAMPFLKGETLEDRLQREKRLPIIEVLRIGRETAEGLAAAQGRGMIHRDIKPANLWLEGEKGRVKVLDFGLARGASDENAGLTQQGAIIGTPAYMAPEQAGSKKVDGRADLFSLGCVLYRMASGEQPFKGTDTLTTLMAVASKQPPAVEKLNPDVPPALAALVRRLMRKAPEQRPATAREVVEALATIEADPNAVPPEETVVEVVEAAQPRRPAPRARRYEDDEDEHYEEPRANRNNLYLGIGLIGGAVLLVVVGVVLVVTLGGKDKPVPVADNQPPPGDSSRLNPGGTYKPPPKRPFPTPPTDHVNPNPDPGPNPVGDPPPREPRRPKPLVVPTLKEAVTEAGADLKDDSRRRAALSRLRRIRLSEDREEVAAAVEKCLKDADKRVRAQAIEALAVWGGPANVAALVKCLDDSDKEIRRAATVALGKFKDEKAAEALVSRLADNPDAATALREMGTAAEPALAAKLKDADRKARLDAIKVLQFVATARSAGDLRPLANDKKDPETSQAARLVLQHDAVVMALVGDLQANGGRGKLSRGDAAKQLALLDPNGRREAVARLLEGLLAAGDAFAAGDFARAMAVWGTPDNVPGLLRQWEKGDTFGGRNKLLLTALAPHKDPRMVDVALPEIGNAFYGAQVRQAILAEGDVAEWPLLQYLNGPSKELRSAACDLLAGVGTSDSVPILEAAAQSPDADFAAKASAALVAIQARLR